MSLSGDALHHQHSSFSPPWAPWLTSRSPPLWWWAHVVAGQRALGRGEEEDPAGAETRSDWSPAPGRLNARQRMSERVNKDWNKTKKEKKRKNESRLTKRLLKFLASSDLTHKLPLESIHVGIQLRHQGEKKNEWNKNIFVFCQKKKSCNLIMVFGDFKHDMFCCTTNSEWLLSSLQNELEDL